MDPISMVKIIGNLKYSTDKATLIASDVYAEDVITEATSQVFVPGKSSEDGTLVAYTPPYTESIVSEVVTQVYERNGRNRFLYRTKNGRYFLVTQTQVKGEGNALIPLTTEEAGKLYYEQLPTHPLDDADAMPDYVIEDA